MLVLLISFLIFCSGANTLAITKNDLLVLLISFSIFCSGANTLARTKNDFGSAVRGKLIFNEEFEELDLDVWSFDPNTQAHVDEFQLYTNRSTNSFTQNGILHIKPTIEIDPDQLNNTRKNFHAIRSARISTKQSFSFTYGSVEIRARTPSGDWLFPALWMMPKDNVYGSWPMSGEIDIMESRGNKNYTTSSGTPIGATSVSSTLHFGPKSSTDGWRHAQDLSDSNTYYSSDFHLYQMTWTPENITFFVDNRNLGTITPPSGGFFELGQFSSDLDNPWVNGTEITPFDREFYIIINLAVGGTHFFADSNVNINGKPWSNTDENPGLQFWEGKDQWLPSWDMDSDATYFLVDYVRVWSL